MAVAWVALVLSVCLCTVSAFLARSPSLREPTRLSVARDGSGGANSVGVIIVDHGSRKNESNERLEHLAASYKLLSQLPIVEAAHMELCEPSIATAFGECVKQGATRIVCYPFFLSPGRHVKEDIPTLLEEAASRHPGIHYSMTAPLGMHEDVLKLIDDTIKKNIA